MVERDFPAARRRFDRRKKNYKRAFLPNPRRIARLHHGISHEIVYIRIPLRSQLREGHADNFRAGIGWRARIQTFSPSNAETAGWAPGDSPQSFHLELVPEPSRVGKSARTTKWRAEK